MSTLGEMYDSSECLIVEPGATRKEVHFPVKDSVWFDFHTGTKHRGGITEVVRPVEAHIPVYVRAGAFIPMAKVVQTTRDYSTRNIDLHYYHDASVASGARHFSTASHEDPTAFGVPPMGF